MKILPISDVHGKFQVLDYILENIDRDSYDLITCSGDIWEGTETNSSVKLENFQKSIDKPILMIQGNHDYWPSSTFDGTSNIHLLHNEGIEIDGVKFYGTPYTINFLDWNHMNDEESLFEMWNKFVPDGLDVLLSHGPPHGYGDNCNQPIYGNTAESKLGSTSLTQIILDKNPKYVFSGHIHTGDRETIMPNGTKVYNVACLDESYKFLGFNPAPSVIELDL